MRMSEELRKETRKALKEMKNKLVEEQRKREVLLSHKTDFAMLEEFIGRVNDNPNLVITMTLADGTRLEFKNVYKKEKTYTEILGEM